MPPRKPMTKRSPRTPKKKETEADERSTLDTVRELDFVSKTESTIHTSTKNEFSQSMAFCDTEISTRSKMVLPHWGDLYRKISQEDYPDFTPQRNPDVIMLDDQVFSNITRSYLHRVACRTLVFPCIKTLGWKIDHVDIVKCTINNAEGECISVFLPVEVQKYYKLRYPKQRLNIDFMVKFYEYHDTIRILASWWKEDKKFTNKTIGWYNTVNIREPYMYLMALIYRLYGEKDCSKFSEAWMPLAYTVAIFEDSFNWGAIISKKLSIISYRTKHQKKEKFQSSTWHPTCWT
jgi:hypothetical protein